MPLTHFAGAAQDDFGDADFYENRILHSGHYLTLLLPYSSSGYLQLFKGENLECLLTGMQNIFNHIGGTPHRIIFDNASTMVFTVSAFIMVLRLIFAIRSETTRKAVLNHESVIYEEICLCQCLNFRT